MESNRLKKLETQVQKDLSEIFRELAQEQFKGLLMTVSNVSITPDLGIARIYVSLFPATNKEEIIEQLNKNKGSIKNRLTQKFQGRLRKMPDLIFYLDDSFDREEEIDRILKGGGESPIR